MKIKNSLTHVLLLAALGLGSVSILGWSQVSAVDTPINVIVGTDYCANIPGVQSTIPSGMVRDSFGNCATPPPPPVDMCDNIAGAQATIPDGYYRENGDCFVQAPPPAPPVDVCPNLDGLQEFIPAGYINDTDGNCVLPPVDLCSNIDGVQTSVPDGMTVDNEAFCSTPPSPAPEEPEFPAEEEPTDVNPFVAPTDGPRTPDPARGGVPRNVPAVLAPIFTPLVEVVPEELKEAVRSLPPVVAQTFPYYIFAILAVIATVLWFQAIREATAATYFAGLLRRERSIAEQKENFIALASHYLRTPLTVMSSGLDLVASSGQVSAEIIEKIRTPILALGASIESILLEVQGNNAFGEIESPAGTDQHQSFLKSAHFWVPVIASVGLVFFANFLLGIVGEVELGTINLIAQILIFVMVVFFFYSALRNHQIRKRNRAHQEQLIANERAIDDARMTFLQRVTSTLQAGLTNVWTYRPGLEGVEEAKYFDDGYYRFASILTKFTLLANVRTSAAASKDTFDLHAVVDSIISQHVAAANQKNITISNNAPSTIVTQHRGLLEFVLNSLVDNAVKFSGENGAISVDAAPTEQRLSISVADSGAGIPSDKQSQLFQPFSRTESAIEFNYEGLGFSLFLDRIIMEYIGGDITVKSEPDKGSTFTLTAEQSPDPAPAPVAPNPFPA